MIWKNIPQYYIPDYKITNFDDITEDILNSLKNNGVDTIMLDIDGTITTHHGTELHKDADDFFTKAKDMNFNLCLITNCSSKRYHEVSELFGPHVNYNIFWPNGKMQNRKPFSSAFTEPAKELGTDLKKCLYIGDQYSTDIWGPKNAGVLYTIKIDTKSSDEEPGIKKIQRQAENQLYSIIKKQTKKDSSDIRKLLMDQ